MAFGGTWRPSLDHRPAERLASQRRGGDRDGRKGGKGVDVELRASPFNGTVWPPGLHWRSKEAGARKCGGYKRGWRILYGCRVSLERFVAYNGVELKSFCLFKPSVKMGFLGVMDFMKGFWLQIANFEALSFLELIFHRLSKLVQD
jgi:hypothetical protein